MGLLDDLIKSIEDIEKEPSKEEEKKPAEIKGQFGYSKEFEEYINKDKTAVGSENKGE